MNQELMKAKNELIESLKSLGIYKEECLNVNERYISYCHRISNKTAATDQVLSLSLEIDPILEIKYVVLSLNIPLKPLVSRSFFTMYLNNMIYLLKESDEIYDNWFWEYKYDDQESDPLVCILFSDSFDCLNSEELEEQVSTIMTQGQYITFRFMERIIWS